MRDDLKTLGAGEGSSNEGIKLHSRHLRGALGEELADGTVSFGEEAVQLLKFHGSYQQDDRDERRLRRGTQQEKAYQFMVRSRIPGGVLTAEQYLAHDELAGRYGNGTLRLTSRQGIQLHGVLKRNLAPTIRHINEVLLSTLAACGDVNRNVMACPAPLQHATRSVVERYTHAIAMHLAPRTRAYHEIWLDGEKIDRSEREPIYGETYLPRKFKIGVASPGDNCVDIYTQDLGFIAEMHGEALQGFTVVVGGGMGSTHGKAETYPRLASPLCFVEPSEVVEVAETIVTIYRDYGDRKNRKHARMKYVVEELGVEWVRQELERRVGRRFAEPHPIRFATADDHLGWHRQADGAWFLGVHVANGRVIDRATSRVRSALREVIARFAPGVRITGQQNVLLTGLHESVRLDVEAVLQRYGVETVPAALGIARRAMACPALPTCGLAVAEAERAMPEILSAVERELADLGLVDEPISIRATGCPNGCARPRMGDIGIIGRSLDSYDIYVGGDLANTRLNRLYAQGVKRDALVASLRPAFEHWKRERHAGEPFGEFMHRIGVLAAVV